EAVHYGFWRKHSAGYLGGTGKGIAATYQLTDEKFQGQPAMLDFLRWDGTPFHEQHTPSHHRRKEQRLARLKAFKARKLGSQPVSALHKKISRGSHPPNPAVDTHRSPAVDTHPGSSKVQQNPAVDTHRISRKDSCSSSPTASELVAMPIAEPEPTRPEPVAQIEPEPKPELEPSAVDGDDMNDNKQEHDLISMIDVLRQFFDNRTTSTAWYRHMQ